MGDLFFIEDANQLDGKILWAAERYRQKYGRAATLVMLHPSLLRGERRLGALRLEPRKTVLPSYVWVGEDARSAKPLAR
ncbi:MAG: hypothetical protein KIT08_06810 [Anaerolineales bacterium]|nr:MAG: hypothetical protein KIT08_06810 [Anaerolineales bacterium]